MNFDYSIEKSIIINRINTSFRTDMYEFIILIYKHFKRLTWIKCDQKTSEREKNTRIIIVVYKLLEDTFEDNKLWHLT